MLYTASLPSKIKYMSLNIYEHLFYITFTYNIHIYIYIYISVTFSQNDRKGKHSQQSQTQVFLVLPNILYLLNQHKQLTDGRDFCCDMVY